MIETNLRGNYYWNWSIGLTINSDYLLALQVVISSGIDAIGSKLTVVVRGRNETLPSINFYLILNYQRRWNLCEYRRRSCRPSDFIFSHSFIKYHNWYFEHILCKCTDIDEHRCEITIFTPYLIFQMYIHMRNVVYGQDYTSSRTSFKNYSNKIIPMLRASKFSFVSMCDSRSVTLTIGDWLRTITSDQAAFFLNSSVR